MASKARLLAAIVVSARAPARSVAWHPLQGWARPACKARRVRLPIGIVKYRPAIDRNQHGAIKNVELAVNFREVVHSGRRAHRR
jgi:hypothetical protein